MTLNELINQAKKEFYQQFTDQIDAENDYYDSQFENVRPCNVFDFLEAKMREAAVEAYEHCESNTVEMIENFNNKSALKEANERKHKFLNNLRGFISITDSKI